MAQRWVVSALLHTAAVIFCVATASFFLLQVIPGDPAEVIAGLGADTETVERVRLRLGLDRPWPERYARWIAGIVRGELGTSYVQGQPVALLLAQRLPVTLRLALSALTMSIVIAVAAAVASRIGPVWETCIRIFEYGAFAFPQFWIALVLVYLFGFRLGWFPIFGSDGEGAYVLPALALAFGNAAVLSRTLRAALSEQRRSTHVLAARSLGISWIRIYLVHMFPMALIPAITVLTIQAGYLLAGTIVVEQVFGLPGLGRLALTAISQRDLPLVQGAVLLFSIVFPVFSLCGDIVARALWPMFRREER